MAVVAHPIAKGPWTCGHEGGNIAEKQQDCSNSRTGGSGADP